MVARSCILAFAMLAASSLVAQGSEIDFKKFLKEHGNKRELQPCKGDSRTTDGFPMCQHHGFRYCMRFLTDDNKPYIFGDPQNKTEREIDLNKDGLDWWEWAWPQWYARGYYKDFGVNGKSQKPKQTKKWIEGMKKTGGTHWCACALCSAEAVERFGCDNLHIQCNATDVAFIRYRVEHDKHTVFKPGLECLEKKCGKNYQKDWPIVGHDCGNMGCGRLYETSLMSKLGLKQSSGYTQVGLAVFACAAVLVSLAVALRVPMVQRGTRAVELLSVEADAAEE